MSPPPLQWWTLPVLDWFIREKLRSDTSWTHHVYTFSSGDHAMSQVVTVWPLIVRSWVKSHAAPCGICGGQTGPSVDFPPSASLFLFSIIPPMLHTHLFIFHLPCIIIAVGGILVYKNVQVFALSKAWLMLGHLFVGSMGSHPLLCKNVYEIHGHTGCDAMLCHILCYLCHYVA